ncbi:MAG TPA: IS66 family insertion sequence element accessory protein TnpB [Flavobacterium sp.]|nr:IS66 family insertion sequence element accessory protein TnpB [Flavobacterium sp.]
MLGLSANLRYFLCCSTIDIRNGFDGLSGIVRNHLKKDPISGDVFIFLNKTRTHIKLLYWDGDGFALFYKRLERGRYAFTPDNGPSKQMKREELLMLLEGLSFGKMDKKKRYKFD